MFHTKIQSGYASNRGKNTGVMHYGSYYKGLGTNKEQRLAKLC